MTEVRRARHDETSGLAVEGAVGLPKADRGLPGKEGPGQMGTTW